MGFFSSLLNITKKASGALLNTMATSSGTTFGGYTIDQWDKRWQCIGSLENANLSPLNNKVGLYRHTINGKTMYLGRAIEHNNGGLRKRLSDYRRNNNSGRTHSSGKTINENLSDIVTYVLIVGDDCEAAQLTKQLEVFFIRKYSPDWNVVNNR